MALINITMLGEFTISSGNKVFSENDIRGNKMRKMLQYLIAHRGRKIPQSEIIELLWDNSDNPVSALKTLVHRTREMLKHYLPTGTEFILSEHSTYSFNTDLDYSIDSGEFERLCKEGNNELLTRTRRVNIYKKALDLYKGNYLSSFSEESWVTPINVYFRTLHASVIEKCVKLLYPMGKFTEIVMICEKAMVINPYDEMLHEHLIKGMTALGEYALAANQYQYLKRLLSDQFGAAPSPRLTEMYELTIKPRNDTHNNLDIVLGDLWEDELTCGGYYCEYEIFRYIFRLYCRENARIKGELPILLISLSGTEEKELSDKTLSKAMQKMSDSISTSLRKRDIYTRYSRSQYILLLPGTPVSDVSIVKKRIVDKFRKSNDKSRINVTFDIQDVSEYTKKS